MLWCHACDLGTTGRRCWGCDVLLPLDSRRPSFTPHPYRPVDATVPLPI